MRAHLVETKMKSSKLLKGMLAAGAVMSMNLALAEPVSLGSIEHLYGTEAGRVAPTTGPVSSGCGDRLNASSVTVAANDVNKCNRFGDNFDFSSISYETIEYFALTVDFSGATDQSGIFGLGREDWRVKAYNNLNTGVEFGKISSNQGSMTFTLNSSHSMFDAIVAEMNFSLLFASEASNSSLLGGLKTFEVYSARLDVYGAPAQSSGAAGDQNVPEPAGLALLGIGVLGLFANRHRKQG